MSLRGGTLLFGAILGFSSAASCVSASELKPHTAKAFEHYVELTEARMQTELSSPDRFLFLDTLPQEERDQELATIKSGQVYVRPMLTKDGDKKIEIPDGLVHHWLAIGFLPHAKLDRVLEVAKDFNHHAEYFKPDVQKSQLLSRQGDHFHVYFQLHRHTVVTVVYNTQFDTDFSQLDATHVYSTGKAVRIAELKNPGEKDEHELTPGRDRGFLWRLNLYTRYEQADDGVYVQIEFLALSRSVPAVFAWLVNPYVKSIPREYLTNYIEKLRQASQSVAPEKSETPRAKLILPFRHISNPGDLEKCSESGVACRHEKAWQAEKSEEVEIPQ